MTPADPRTVIEARSLAKSYLEGARAVRVLRGLDLTIRAGEFAAVLGPSGSGKSTLLNLLGLMSRPSSGEVLVFGEPTSAMSESRLAALRNQSIGFVFQFNSLLPEFTVLENITMPSRISSLRASSADSANARARELLGKLGLSGLEDRFPAQISGGESQRAVLARALMNRPGVLLADEPTGNLDRPNGELVFNHLRELAESEGTAVILVTHNEDAAQFASRTIRLADGRIEAAPGV